MGTPNYPKDMATEWNKMKRDIKGNFTSGNSRKGISSASGDITIYGGALNILDAEGNTKLKIGKLPDDSYGLAVVDGESSVDIAALAFGQQMDLVEAEEAEDDGPGGYTDLATVGPIVQTTIGNSGRCLVTVSAEIKVATRKNLGVSTGAGYMSFEVSGPINRNPSSSRAAYNSIKYDCEGLVMNVPAIKSETSATRTVLMSGLQPGFYTFTAKYLTFGDLTSPARFSNRLIIVEPF